MPQKSSRRLSASRCRNERNVSCRNSTSTSTACTDFSYRSWMSARSAIVCANFFFGFAATPLPRSLSLEPKLCESQGAYTIRTRVHSRPRSEASADAPDADLSTESVKRAEWRFARRVVGEPSGDLAQLREPDLTVRELRAARVKRRPPGCPARRPSRCRVIDFSGVPAASSRSTYTTYRSSTRDTAGGARQPWTARSRSASEPRLLVGRTPEHHAVDVLELCERSRRSRRGRR